MHLEIKSSLNEANGWLRCDLALLPEMTSRLGEGVQIEDSSHEVSKCKFLRKAQYNTETRHHKGILTTKCHEWGTCRMTHCMYSGGL